MRLKQLFSLILFLVSLQQGVAQWKLNDTKPVVVSDAPNYQAGVLYATDEEANSYYVWIDYRTGSVDLYVQKFNNKGVPQWEANGLKIGKVLDKFGIFYNQKVIRPDGNGGVFVGWHLLPDPDNASRREFYAQRISKEGTLLWGEQGIKVTDRETWSMDPYDDVLDVVDLKNNQLLFFYNQYVGATGTNTVYTKKLDYDGNTIEEEKKLFENNRIEDKVIYDTKNNRFLAMIKDNQADYLFQTFNADNTPIVSNPVVIYQNPVAGNSRIDLFRVDNDGNAIIGRTLTIDDGRRFVFAHKVDVQGSPVWGANGVNMGSDHTFDIQVVPTSDGGGIATWLETANQLSPFMIAKLTANGTMLWRKEVFSPRSSKPYLMPNKLQPDGKDGVYTLWLAPKEIGYDLTVQHFDSNGLPRFGNDGIAFKDYTFYSDSRVIPYPAGGVIVFWGANKELSDGIGFSVDLYTNYINENGRFGFEEPASIDVSPLAVNKFCAGQSFSVSASTIGPGFNLDNSFRVLLSDKEGSFTNAVEIGRDIRKTISVRLPQELETGKYQIKIVSTSPVIESNNSIEIETQEVAVPVITVDKTKGCVGDSFNFTGVGCDIGTIKWSNNAQGKDVAITVENTNTFTAVCSIPGCKNSQPSNEILVFINTVTATATNSGPFNVGEVIKLSSTGGVKYAWTGPGSFTSADQNPSITNATLAMGGIYTVVVTDDNNCTGKAQTTVQINNILGVEREITIQSFPNPASKELIVEFHDVANSQVGISMVDMKGRIIGEKKLKAAGGYQKEVLDVRYFPSGQYLMRVKTSKQEIVKKIIVEN